MHCFVRQCVIHRAENVFGGEVKVIGAAGGEVELLLDRILRGLRLLRTDNGVEPDNIEIFQILHRWIAGTLLAEHNEAKVGILLPVIGVQCLGKCLMVRIARNRVAVACQGSILCDGLLRVEGEIQQIDVPLGVSGVLIQFIRFFALLLPQRRTKQIEVQAAVRVAGGGFLGFADVFPSLGRREGDCNVCQRLHRCILVTLGKGCRRHKA
ncbi:unknown [Firmicutes bacterium CAG:102]|nr:unknown [Firmicutes bacterium CAG:102]